MPRCRNVSSSKPYGGSHLRNWKPNVTRHEFGHIFLSYTEQDDELSRRLRSDLTAAGFRPWRWRENARCGQELIAEIDEQIRACDRFLLILSEASLKSQPVIREIVRALQKEERERRNVICPIRVDETIFSWNHPLQADIVPKVILDFRGWQDPVVYQAALQRLLHDLRGDRVRVFETPDAPPPNSLPRRCEFCRRRTKSGCNSKCPPRE